MGNTTRTVTIPTELYSTKNSKRIVNNKNTGKPFIVNSSAASKGQKLLSGVLSDPQLKDSWGHATQGLDYPYQLEVKIYRKTRRRFDYVNIVQGLFDMLVKCDYLPDDSMDYITPVFIPYEVDKENPRVELTFVESE